MLCFKMSSTTAIRYPASLSDKSKSCLEEPFSTKTIPFSITVEIQEELTNLLFLIEKGEKVAMH